MEQNRVAGNEEQLESQLKEKWPKFYNAVFGDIGPTTQGLLTASLFVMTYECLKGYVEESFQGFFSDGYEKDETGTLVRTFNDKWPDVRAQQKTRYRDLAKTLANMEMGRITLFQESCAWFHEMEAITDDDMTIIISVSKLRNGFAHDLYKWLFDDCAPQIDSKFVNAPLDLYFKISNWWVKNFEASIIPEDYDKFSEDDMRSATSMQALLLQFLIKRVLEKSSEQK